MHWIYLSPHLDDAALSCGGLIWEQAQAGDRVEVWTVCASDPPPGPLSPFAESLHARWKVGREAVTHRRAEDRASCQIMDAAWRHFSIPDCIYRRLEGGAHPYASEEALFSPLHAGEARLVEMLGRELAQAAPPEARLVCPLALGGHVDHRLARAAAEQTGLPLWYYADYPSVLQTASQLDQLRRAGWESIEFAVSKDGLSAWVRAVAAHASQISTFWPDNATMEAALRDYCRDGKVTL